MTEAFGPHSKQDLGIAPAQEKMERQMSQNAAQPIEVDRPDVRALFLGPKSENRQFFLDNVESLLEEHIHWRRNYHPLDKAVFTHVDTKDATFQRTQGHTQDILEELTSRLKASATPWFSTRYLGHMNSDTLMVSNLAEIATLLYNPNNVAYEASVATSQMEHEVGRDLCTLYGYDDKSWGHITADGTIANYEGLWLARNLKSFPMAVKAVAPELVEGKSDWELLNHSVDEALTLMDEVKKDPSLMAKVLSATARGKGMGDFEGKVLVPGTRHYSWDKACDILGIGVENLIKVPLDEYYRTDMAALAAILDQCIADQTPVIAVINVVGTTEEGAVDDIAQMVELRAEYAAKGLNFFFHVDAAYGGYGRALFLDEDNRFMELDEVRARLAEDGLAIDGQWPSHNTWAGYRAAAESDCVTIDPHKMGYVPYAAGGVIFRDRRMLGLVSYTAAYVFEGADADNLDEGLGSVTMEGSKAGMTAAGVWAAHRLLPLNYSGYGQVIGRSWASARRFMQVLGEVERLEVAGRTVVLKPVVADADFNMICMAFNFEGNTDLELMNLLNQEMYYNFSYEYGPLYKGDWITSHTVLDRDVYGESPVPFLRTLGITAQEWGRVGRVTILRSSVMHPWIAEASEYPQQWHTFQQIVAEKLAGVIPGVLARHEGR